MPGAPRRLAGALAVLALAGCVATPEAPPAVIGGIPADEVGQLLRRWEAEWREFRGLRAFVDLRLLRRGRGHRGAGVLLISPTQLRFEGLTPLGLPALVVSAGPDRVTVFSAAEGRAWTARPTAEAMGRWLGVPVPPDTLIRLLVGRVPLPPDGASARVATDGAIEVAPEGGAPRQRVWVTERGWPARIELEDGEVLTAAFEWTVGGVLQSVTVSAPRRAVEAHVRYGSAEHIAPPPEAFEIVLPPGVAIQQLD